MFLPCPCTNGFAAGVRYRAAVPFERMGVGEPGGVKAGRSVRVACDLAAGQDARHQHRPVSSRRSSGSWGHSAMKARRFRRAVPGRTAWRPPAIPRVSLPRPTVLRIRGRFGTWLPSSPRSHRESMPRRGTSAAMPGWGYPRFRSREDFGKGLVSVDCTNSGHKLSVCTKMVRSGAQGVPVLGAPGAATGARTASACGRRRGLVGFLRSTVGMRRGLARILLQRG